MPIARVDHARLERNLDLLRGRLAPGTEILAAVKADAYGHGAIETTRALEGWGVGWFGVATPDEALELRRAGVTARVLLLGPIRSRIAELVEADVDLTVAGWESLDALRRSGAPRPARVHLKVDTGMGRLGHPPDDALGLARELADEPGAELTAVWTHFACADDADRRHTLEQIAAFDRLLARLERESIAPPLVHAANSAAILRFPEAHYGLVRTGIALYGYPPGAAAESGSGLVPVMSVSAPVTFVKRVPAGTSVSYGSTWRAPRDTTVVTVRFGYADGYPRLLGNRGWARLAGHRVPVVGRVCMDQLMLDAGDLDVAVGDRAILLDAAGPTADHLAELAGTISYEILTSLSRRVERVHG